MFRLIATAFLASAFVLGISHWRDIASGVVKTYIAHDEEAAPQPLAAVILDRLNDQGAWKSIGSEHNEIQSGGIFVYEGKANDDVDIQCRLENGTEDITKVFTPAERRRIRAGCHRILQSLDLAHRQELTDRLAAEEVAPPMLHAETYSAQEKPANPPIKYYVVPQGAVRGNDDVPWMLNPFARRLYHGTIPFTK